MAPLKYLSCLMLLAFAACNKKPVQQEVVQAQKDSTVIVQGASLAPLEIYFYKGQINGKWTIQATIKEQGDSISGYYRYAGKSQFLTLKGARIQDSLLLTEYDPNGKITGSFKGKQVNDSLIEGTWLKADLSKRYSFYLAIRSEDRQKGAAVIVSKIIPIKDYANCVCGQANLPFIADGLYPEKADALNKQLDFATLYDPASAQCWCANASGLVSVDYTLHFNQKYVLSIGLYSENRGAYPSYNDRYLNFNLHTGQAIALKDLVSKSGLAFIQEKVTKSVNASLSEAKINAGEDAQDLSSLFEVRTIQDVNELAFHFEKEGLVLHYDYGFPHVALAYEPSGDVIISYAALKPFILSEGLLVGF
jgi:hypothetical protein